MLDDLTDNLIDARAGFLMVSPGIGSTLRHVHLKRGFGLGMLAYGIVKNKRDGKSFRDFVVNLGATQVSGRIMRPVMKPVHENMNKAYIWASEHSGPGLVIGSKPDAKGLENTRTWINTPGRYKMVIVYHEAFKAGPHIDVHIGHLSVIYRVKPDLYAKLKFNKDGSLTNASKEHILAHVRSEISNGSRVPQNLDHPDDQATYSWLSAEEGPQGYGAATSRQVVSESEVDVYKAYDDGPIEFFSPVIDPTSSLYLYEIYHGEKTGVPIIIWGKKVHNPPVVDDRLHLKMVDPADLDKMSDKMDMATSTAKYDGSSVYLRIDKKGTTAWSPRISKRTGRRIEYTPKINGLAAVGTNGTVDETIVAMGELMFYRTGRNGKKIWLDHGTSGGLLNSHDLVPADVHPCVVVYRIDRMGRNKTLDLPFWEQRALIQDLVNKNPDHLMLPELMTPKAAKRAGYEGVVICRPGESVQTAFKTKWWTEADDWQIDSVDFTHSEKGNVAGVVWFTSLESGKKFKLGPGGLGDRALCEHMMMNPDLYVGAVCKVRSRHGHEGRAAKVEEFHPDKGFAPE